MKNPFIVFARACLRCVRSPSRLKALADPNARKVLALRLQGVDKEFLAEDSTAAGGISRRAYRSYDVYVRHQRSKLDMLTSGGSFGVDSTNLKEYDNKFRSQLRTRLQSLNLVASGQSVLCLAARLGTEVKAFLDCGCFAVGVDLNPGKENPFVLPGDFHNLIFSDGSVDHVYCNSIDHAFDLKKLFAEIYRVLKPGGDFIAELQLGASEGSRVNTGQWESLSWESTQAVQEQIEAQGFHVGQSHGFSEPWPGRCLVAKKV
jgi:SAM-dependent methyltransferase